MASSPASDNMSNLTNSSALSSPLSNLTLNDTTPANATYSWPPLQFIHANFDLITVQLRIVLSAISIIILSANAALRRPPSAAPSTPPPPTTSGKRRRKRHREMDAFTEGLQASDAIMFPLMAGAMLIGLYYLIQWLRDPAILNKILTGYLSLVSVASLGKLFGDALSVFASVVFPGIWVDTRGRVFKVDPVERCHWRCEKFAHRDNELSRVKEESLKIPVPTFQTFWGSRPSPRRIDLAWTLRRLVKEEWTVKLAAHGVGKGEFGVTLADAMGGVLALVVAVIYTITGSSMLGNLMGAGLCYGALMIMSCTSFFIGTMVLVGLFFYDIVMVFYTPFMITVATKIDAPIKLTFQAGKASTLLGLGDIVVPGIFMCLALRFDLWRHYHHKIKYVPRALKKTEATTSQENGATSSSQVTTTTEQKMQAVKVPFVNPQGRWGDWLWTLARPSDDTLLPLAAPALTASSFPKPYFKAVIAGYLAGMLATLAVLFVFRRGQPALLYLVPGVVGAVWLTGLVRGELKELWMYTEDGSLDTEDVIVEVDDQGEVIGLVIMEEEGEKKDGEKDKKDEDVKKKVEDKKKDEATNDGDQKESKGNQGHDVFLFSIHAPGDNEVDEDEV